MLRQTAGQARQPTGTLFEASAAAAVTALLLGLISGRLDLAISWKSLVWLMILTLTSGIVGWLLIIRSLPQLRATVSALILLLEPAGAVVLGAIGLGQWPSLLQICGSVLVCGGVLLVAAGQSPGFR